MLRCFYESVCCVTMASESDLIVTSTQSVLTNVTFNRSGVPDVEIPTYIVVTSTLLYILIFFVGIVGNALVVIVITFSRSMKTSVNMYLSNLCVADILVIIVCMPTALADIYTKEEWLFGEAMCKLVPFLENTVANASVLTILAISIERYRVVCYPLKGIDEHKVKIWKIVAATWVVSIGSSAPLLSIPILRSSRFTDGTPIIVCRSPIVLPWQRTYVIVLFVMFFLLPCILLFALNCHLCRVFRATQENNPCITDSKTQAHERKRRKRQVIKIIGSLVMIFFICHLPFRVTVLWFTFADKYSIRSLGLESYLNILYSARIMFYINHSLNPVVYNFVSTKFRSALNRLFSKGSVSRSGLSFMSMDTMKSRQQTAVLYTAGMRSPRTRNTLIGSGFTASQGLASNRAAARRTTSNDSVTNYKLRNGTTPIKEDGSSSSDKDYDLKIRLKDNTVAIKFNLTPSSMP